MRRLHAARVALLVASFCFCGLALADQYMAKGSTSAFEARNASLHELDTARVPSGLIDLCRRSPSFCAPDDEAPRAFILTPEHYALLARVNSAVNQQIASTTDEKLYGKAEYWTLPTTAGDCEDYVLLKRKMLIELGVPRSSLLMTVVHDENGEGHAVLTVPSQDGDLVLDNRRDEILHWWETGYKFIKRQSEADTLKWVSLGREKLQATNLASGPEAR